MFFTKSAMKTFVLRESALQGFTSVNNGVGVKDVKKPIRTTELVVWVMPDITSFVVVPIYVLQRTFPVLFSDETKPS